jgi:serine/threonine protein kinase/tetratricopeptide (TPR) repeat protein
MGGPLVIPLGPFELETPIGQGGMGQVWRGVHRRQNVPVALKVLSGERSRDERFLGAFKQEVRAVAGLEHPDIVMVLDYGVVTDEASVASGGAMEAGNPYLAMELVDGGSIAEMCGRRPWSEIRGVLSRVLDALAHAHARGTIHRDIKPANVLRLASTGAIKVTDFGLSHVFDVFGAESSALHDGVHTLMGTPAYMAPEQVRGDLRAIGPWTDLYALGCTAYALATGSSPFGRQRTSTLEDVIRAHLDDQVPPMEARCAVPPGFEGWVKTLLEKDPAHRFRCAADAAWSLSQLTDVKEDDFEAEGWEDLPSPTATQTVTLVFDRRDLEAQKAPVISATGLPIAPMPGDWRPAEMPLRPTHLVDAGLALYGLRTVPMVDREPERDTLWRSLARVSRSGRGRLVLLEGAAGCGKSRLADWLCERAHEVGAAEVMTVVHGATPGAGDGMAPLLARHLRCQELPREGILERVRAYLAAHGEGDDDAEALTELIQPLTPEEQAKGVRRVRFVNPTERHVLLERVIRRAAIERPVVLWIDDIQWGLDSLGYVHRLMGSQAERPFPVMIVLTARSEALREHPTEARVLEEKILPHDGTLRIPVGPLEAPYQPELVSRLLSLEESLVGEVAARTAGNPLFAVQLVGDWVEREILEPGDGGFRLKEGVDLDLPANLQEMWEDRIEALLVDRPEAEISSLELAAVLGHEVSTDEWRAVSEITGHRPELGLVHEMIDRRLAISHEGGPHVGWSFAHGMLREVIELRARAEGRFEHHHRACAEVLTSAEGPGISARLGRHLLMGGLEEQALGPLLAGAREHFSGGDNWEAGAIVRDVSRLIERLSLPRDDPRHAQTVLLSAQLARRRGDLEEALSLAREMETATEDSPLQSERCDVLLLMGHVLMDLGRLDNALVNLRSSLALAEDLGDLERTVHVRSQLLYVLTSAARLDEAEAMGQRALKDAELLGDPATLAWVLRLSCRLQIAAGHLDRAADYIARAEAPVMESGDRFAVATRLNTVGELHRLRDDVESAEAIYREAMTRYEAIGAGSVIFPEINLGLLLAQRGAYAEAMVYLERVLRRSLNSGQRPLEAGARSWLSVCAAGRQEWSRCDDQLERADELLQETGYVDSDMARAFFLVGHLAGGAGQILTAREAYQLSIDQWVALGRHGDAEPVQERLRALG